MVVIVNEDYQVDLDIYIYLPSKLLHLTVLGKLKYLFNLQQSCQKGNNDSQHLEKNV